MENVATLPNQFARRLATVLADFGVSSEVTAAHKGPIVTLYEVSLARGVKASKVVSLASDIARCLAVTSARVTIVPGSMAVGIEVPNARREIVSLAELFRSDQWLETEAKLPIILGKDMTGYPVVVDLARMPHLLIAGTTGSGKSVGIHAMINSLLNRFTSAECRLILIDPKMLEMSQYSGIPHLLTPVIIEPEKAVTALKWTLLEMERRYQLMSQLNLRNISHYNEMIANTANANQLVRTYEQVGFDDNGNPEYEYTTLPLERMPFIVVVIDEVADLMMVAGKEIEVTVQRLAQMARAAGIHLVMATQRPSVDIITGSIKANFPSRISFQLQSKIDSRTILGQPGAEQLVGNGDMMFMQGASLTRIQGAYVSTEEIEDLVMYRKSQQGCAYVEEITECDFG